MHPTSCSAGAPGCFDLGKRFDVAFGCQVTESPGSLCVVMIPTMVDYRELFERTADAILVTDAEGRYIDANPAACELTGYGRDELLRMRVGDLSPKSDRDYSTSRFALLRKTGATRADRVIVRKDGSRVTVEARAISLGDGIFQTSLRDVSDRLEAEAQLRRSLEAYSTLVDLCNAGVISADAKGCILSWNPAATELFGYSEADAVGSDIAILIPERYHQEHGEGFARHLVDPQDKAFARKLYTDGKRKDGSEFPVEISLAVGWRDDELLFTAVVRDITEHQDMVEQLNDALQRLQFHVARMPLAYIVWDTEFRVLEWNLAAERLFGYSASEAHGRHAYDLVVPPDIVPLIEKTWAGLLAGDSSSHSINTNMRKDGSRMSCEWFNTPLRDLDGGVRGVASMAMDVSVREALEARIRDAQKVESLGILVGGIAHDFNSALMVILGNTALLRSLRGLPQKAKEYVQPIEEAGFRAKELIKHLLAYARTGRHNPQPTDLNATINEALKLVRSSMGKKHVLDVKLAEHLPSIVADRSQIEQIVLNLCMNAKESMSDGGTISIETRKSRLTGAQAARCVPFDVRPGDYVEFEVGDTGCGMDEGTVSRMFDPFFTTKADGHGLGMAAVLGILRQHNAAALVQSKIGESTRIRVFFPCSTR